MANDKNNFAVPYFFLLQPVQYKEIRDCIWCCKASRMTVSKNGDSSNHFKQVLQLPCCWSWSNYDRIWCVFLYPSHGFVYIRQNLVNNAFLTKAKNCCGNELIIIWSKLWKQYFLRIFVGTMLESCTNMRCLWNDKFHVDLLSTASDFKLYKYIFLF